MPASSRRSWVKWLVTLVILGAIGAGGWWYWKHPKDSEIEFRTATATRGDITQAVTANGQLTPVVDVEVGSQVSGIIEKIYADFNSRVTNGQVLVQIEASTFKANVDQAAAELANARATLELAQVNARRYEELAKNKLIPQSDYDSTMAALHQAEAMVKMREASLKRVQTDLDRTTIYAPIDGIVIVRNVEMGQTVAASFNTPKLFQIANDLSKMEIDAMVSEADVGGVEEGQKVSFTVDAFPTRQFQGRVKQVRYAPSTNQNVVTYTTVVEVDNAELKLRPGMTANASIITAERKGVIRLANAALRFRPPEGATVIGETNMPSLAGSATNAAVASTRVATSGPFAGLPEPPWQAEGRRPTSDEREKYEASLTQEQKEQYRQIRERMRARMAEGGGGPGGGMGGGMSRGGFGSAGSSPNATQEGPRTQTIYLLEKQPKPTGGERAVLRAVTVKTGITDGSFSEVLEGLKEGDVVVTGQVKPEPSATSVQRPTGSSPFGGPFPRRF